MRLRASGEHTGDSYDLRVVLGAEGGHGGIDSAALLGDFAEALCAADAERTRAARTRLLERLGAAALADSAAVVAGFNAFPRVADAIGIPLEDQKAELTADLRADLGLDALNTAGTPGA